MTDLRALVVDDEPLARRRLRALLDRTPGVQWMAEAATGPEALRAIEEAGPDVVFLDVEMPGMSGVEVMERVNPPLPVIFTTAYDAYAVKAFDLHAVDYLLKPLSADRLREAVERVRRRLADRSRPARQIFARERGRIVPIPVSTIVRLEADGDYVHVHAAGRAHLITATLSSLHERLDADRFRRVHRSHVVNMDFVTAFEPCESSRLRLRMRNGDTVVASRARSRELRAEMGRVGPTW